MSQPTTSSQSSAPAPGTQGIPGNPAAPGSADIAEKTVRQRVAEVLGRIRPAIQSDGGDLELVDVTPDGIVRIRLLGACVGCPSSSMTLHMGIERNLKEKVPEVQAVEQVH